MGSTTCGIVGDRADLDRDNFFCHTTVYLCDTWVNLLYLNECVLERAFYAGTVTRTGMV